MVKGMLGLLQLCPQEVAHLRKELLIAARHILATDLRNSEYTLSLPRMVAMVIVPLYYSNYKLHCNCNLYRNFKQYGDLKL